MGERTSKAPIPSPFIRVTWCYGGATDRRAGPRRVQDEQTEAFGCNDQDTSSQDAAVATALRRGADTSTNSRAVLQAIRDPKGALVGLEKLLYGNDAYWLLSGLDPKSGVGHTFSTIERGIDWTEGIAGRLFHAMESGRDYADGESALDARPGPRRARRRVFDVEFAGDRGTSCPCECAT